MSAASEAMRLSLSEIEAMARKAARGGGCPWGLAEEAGKVARWLAAHGLPGPEALAALLAAPRNCRCGGNDDAPLCPLSVGAQLSDEAAAVARSGRTELGTVAHPLLLLAQAGRSATALGIDLTLQWAGFSATCAPDGMSLEHAAARDAAVATDVVCLSGMSAGQARPPLAGSRPVTAAAIATLEAFAARTYAPATEASRRTGAGAANLDKD